MTSDSFQLTRSAAQNYEAQKVPAIFRPLAEATVAEVELNENDKVLDVACGTGIVARVVGEWIPTVTRLVGSDLNDGMLDVARELTKQTPFCPDWLQADVGRLPFETGSFGICFCRQGLQYFPDKVGALRELRRMLIPNGRLVLTAWSDISPFIAALSESFGRHVGAQAAQGALAPFAFRDREAISALIEEAGFEEHTVRVVTTNRILGVPSESIPREIAGIPVGGEVIRRGPKVMEVIVAEVAEAIAEYQVGEGFLVPQTAYLFEGVA